MEKTHQSLNLMLIQENKHKMLVSLAKKNVAQNLLATAIETLTKKDDMVQFLEELGQLYNEIRGNESGREAARTNLGYMLGYYTKADRKRWFNTFPDVSHPFFGRQEVSPGEAFKHGVEQGRKLAANNDRGDGGSDSPE